MLLEDGTRFDGELCGAGGRGHRRGRLQHRDDRLPGGGHRPLLRGPDHHLHLSADRQLRRLAPRRWSPTASTPAAVIMREAKNGEDAADAEGGWLDWLARLRRAGDQRRRHPRARPPHPRPRARCAAGSSRPSCPRREARERVDGRAVDGRRRPRPDRDAGRADRVRRRRPARGRDRHRDQALDRPPAPRARLPGDAAALHGVRRGGARARPRPRLPRQRPRRPGGARLRRRHGPRAGRQAARSSASASATSCSAGRSASRPSSCPFGHRGANHPVKDLATGRIDITSQNHGFAVHGPGGEPRIEADEPVRWETDFGAAELSHLNLYDRTVEGLVLRDVPGGDGPVPPGGRPRPARRPLPLRPLPGTRETLKVRPPTCLAPRRHPEDPPDRLRADRDRAGGRVRLLRRAGLQGPARGGLRGRARQLQPGDDHDRPGVRHRTYVEPLLPSPVAADHRAGAPRRAAADARRPDRAQPRDGAARRRASWSASGSS